MDGNDMTANEQDLRALAYLAERLRTETPGAGKWDQPGIWAVLKRMEGHNLALVIERVTRHAADPEARNPGAIERPFVPDAPRAAHRFPPKGDQECPAHLGEWAHACRICNGPPTVDETPEDRTRRRVEVSKDYAAHVDHLRRVKAGETT